MTLVEKTELRKWRFRTPGVIASLAVAPLAWHLGLFTMNEKVVWNLFVPAFGAIVSFSYEAFKVRRSLWIEEMENYIGQQIRDKIVEMIPSGLAVTPQEITFLRETKIIHRLNGIFWEAIDRDPLLSAHKEAFYDNGKYYSTAFDLFIICGTLVTCPPRLEGYNESPGWLS